MRDDSATVTARLAAALRDSASPWAGAALVRLPDKGLAHDHVRITGSGLLARIPKQSQMRLTPADNLAYQAACFERAAARPCRACTACWRPAPTCRAARCWCRRCRAARPHCRAIWPPSCRRWPRCMHCPAARAGRAPAVAGR